MDVDACPAECLRDLTVEVDAVRHQDGASAQDQTGERSEQEHHRQALARALGVPDHAAAALAVGARVADASDGVLDGLDLLVPRHDPSPALEEGEVADQLEQALGAGQVPQREVLGRRRPSQRDPGHLGERVGLAPGGAPRGVVLGGGARGAHL